jgi:sugar/nucleoside kinase (ribokinase family)
MFDGILINMITGFDITIDNLRKIRKDFHGLIYLDVHMLSRGLDKDNQRRLRLIPNTMEWISSADIIQVNENEIYSLTEKKSEILAAKDILSYGLKYLLVTKGELGATVFFYEEGELKSYFMSSFKLNSVRKIGSGDIFGATFFYFYLRHFEFQKALKAAIIAAGYSTSYTNLKEFMKLRNDTYSKLN